VRTVFNRPLLAWWGRDRDQSGGARVSETPTAGSGSVLRAAWPALLLPGIPLGTNRTLIPAAGISFASTEIGLHLMPRRYPGGW
jgi:hypothetical protein